MCRHFAWLGAPRTLAELIFQPSYGLPRQAARPRWQNIDLVNRDGFGAGWFPMEGHGPAATYRRAVPFEDDASFATLAGEVRASCVLGAVRGASPGMPVEEAATAPFTNGSCLLSLNGHLNRAKTSGLLDPAYTPESACDAALLATFLWQRLDAGAPLERAVPELLRDVLELDPDACLNMLATDGRRIVATTWAETLCYRIEPGGVIVASEPHDDEGGWIRIPDGQIIVADADAVDVRPVPFTPATMTGLAADEPAA